MKKRKHIKHLNILIIIIKNYIKYYNIIKQRNEYHLEKELIDEWREKINNMETRKYNEHMEKCRRDVKNYKELEEDIIVSYKILSKQSEEQKISRDITNLSLAVFNLSNCLLQQKPYEEEIEKVVYL